MIMTGHTTIRFERETAGEKGTFLVLEVLDLDLPSSHNFT